VDIYRYSSIQHLDSDELHIRDLDRLKQVIERCKSSRNVVTPRFLLDGYVNYLQNDFPKRCPYLDSPTLGSKFFIQPNGDVLVCMGHSIGNLLTHSPRELIKSPAWEAKLKEFESCEGCWNPCYTTFSGSAALAEMATKLRKVARRRE
jgi:sulfatase maturation enzyme AslB (radical SAM superfamily)